MDNDNKVTTGKSNYTARFLKEDLLPAQKPPQIYNLDSEFAKTKKNVSVGFYVLFIGFIGLLVVFTIFLSRYIDTKNRQVEINITDFQDVNLKDLLTRNEQNQDKLSGVRQELSLLKQELQDKIIQLKDNDSREKELLLTQSLTDAEKTVKITEINAKTEKAIQTLRSSYEWRIRDKENEIARLSTNVSTDHAVLLENAEKSDTLLDNYNKLHKIQMEKQRLSYENRIREIESDHGKEIVNLTNYYQKYITALVLKYNPIFKSDKVNAIINSADGQSDGEVSSKDYSATLEDEGVSDEVSLELLKLRISNYTLLMDQFLQIPYTNSVAPALKKLNKLSKQILQDYSKLTVGFVDILFAKNSIIENYHYSLDYYIKLKRENGYVVDPRDDKNMVVYIDSIYKVKKGDTALVFRSDDAFLGQIKLYPQKDYVRAELVSIESTNRIQPYDRIMLVIKP